MLPAPAKIITIEFIFMDDGALAGACFIERVAYTAMNFDISVQISKASWHNTGTLCIFKNNFSNR